MSFILWDRTTTKAASCSWATRYLWLDKFGIWIAIIVCVGVLMASLITDEYLRREGFDGPEIYALYMLAGASAPS